MDFNHSEIKDYLEGRLPDRADAIRGWLIDPKNEFEVRRILGEIWTHSQISLKGDKPDFDQLLNKLHYRIGSINESQKNEKVIHRIYRSYSKIAAFIVLPLLLFTIFFIAQHENKYRKGKMAMREIYTKPGTRTKLELPDGTMVWLNDGTSLKYPEHFTGKTRKVYVDGEAFFDVKSNPQNPFVVQHDIMNINVTGTRFNLNAYSGDKFFEVTLQEGKIHLEGKNGFIDMKPGQQIQFQYDNEGQQFIKKEINAKYVGAWIDGKLIIHNERLDMAIKKLSRWYNVEIQIDDPELNGYELTCTIKNEKLEQCFDLISHALPIKYNFKEELSKHGHIHYKIQLMKK